MRKMNKLFKFFLFLLLLQVGCQSKDDLVINNSHLDYLYEEIKVGEKDMAIIHIYSNYPEYDYVGDDDEGIACVDDAARAAVYYLYDWNSTGNENSIEKNKKLIEFLLYMQADNGYFYNFIWDDYSINKDFRTSVAEPNWWSWRVLWALTESYNYYKQNDYEFAGKMWQSIENLITAIQKNIPTEYKFENISGLQIPDWLPHKYASDQAAVLLPGLFEYYNQTKDTVIYNYIEKLCEGITAMQLDEDEFEFNGAFLSWQNLWHSWGNIQSYALLKCYPILGNEKIFNSALNELENFYRYLINNGYLNSFTVEKVDGKLKTIEEEKFSQIAYNIRPMVFALIEAYKLTGKDEYAEQAANLAKWLTGENPAHEIMYDSKTGRVYDGINSENEINKNSGAESTIEGLLTLQKIKENKKVLEYFLRNEDE